MLKPMLLPLSATARTIRVPSEFSIRAGAEVAGFTVLARRIFDPPLNILTSERSMYADVGVTPREVAIVMVTSIYAASDGVLEYKYDPFSGAGNSYAEEPKLFVVEDAPVPVALKSSFAQAKLSVMLQYGFRTDPET